MKQCPECNELFDDQKAFCDMDGSELITKLKASPTTARIPVVVIAGRATQTGPADIRANYVIYKDIEIESQLAKALASALGDEAVAQG